MHSYWKSLKITIHLYYGWAFNDDRPTEHLPLHRTCGLQWSGARLCVMTRSRQKIPRKWPHFYRNWGAIKFHLIPRNPRVVWSLHISHISQRTLNQVFCWIFFLPCSDRNLVVLAPIWSNQISCRLNRSLLGFSTVAYQASFKWKSRGFLRWILAIQRLDQFEGGIFMNFLRPRPPKRPMKFAPGVLPFPIVTVDEAPVDSERQ